MKRVLCLLLCILLLSGCVHTQENMDLAMELRSHLQQGDGCSFTAQVTADYQDEIHKFSLVCQEDSTGKMQFSVMQPDSIKGITGYISADNAALTFDDTVLAFSPLADGQIAPVVAPWLVLHSLKSGYLSATSDGEDGYIIYIDDAYFRQTVRVIINIDSNNCPAGAEIYWQGRQILSLQIQNFAYV